MTKLICVVLSLFSASVGLGCGERPLEPRDPTPGVPHFKVATYNVEFDRSNDAGTLSAVGKTEADIIAIQEVTPNWKGELEALYSGRYPYMLFHVKGDRSAGGLAVLSRFPVIDGGIRPAPNDWHPAWHVQVETPFGTIQLLNIHLRAVLSGNSGSISSYLSTGDDHEDEARLFAQQCELDVPTVVLGDFNEDPDGQAVQYFESLGFRNVLPLYRPGQFTWRHSSVADQFTKTLDHILFDEAFEPLNAWTLNEGASDHLPVVAHLELAHQL